MVIDDWDALYRSLTIEVPRGRPVPKPTPEALDAYEKRVGRRLPLSYRGFISTFGPGAFQCALQVAAPGYRYLDSDLDIEIANESYRETDEELEHAAPTTLALLRRLWYFGYGGSSQRLGWDPEDVRDSADAEYAIYAVGSCDVQLVATSFGRLIESTCEVIFAPDPNWCEEDMGPRRSFEPAVISE